MAARTVVLDIETYRTRNQKVIDEIEAEVTNQEPGNKPRNIPKDEWEAKKQMWHTDEGRELRLKKALDKTAVDVLKAEILVIVAMEDGEEPEVFEAMASQGEREALKEFTDWADDRIARATTWVGHNISSFDLSVLLNRFRALRVNPTYNFPEWTGRYWKGRVFDTMKMVPNNDGLGLVSVENVCMAYGVKSPKGIHKLPDGTPLEGAMVGKAFEAGCFDLIMKYCADDVVAERELYRVLTYHGTRDCYEAEDNRDDVLHEILESEHSRANKALLVLAALADQGRVSREFVPKGDS